MANTWPFIHADVKKQRTSMICANKSLVTSETVKDGFKRFSTTEQITNVMEVYFDYSNLFKILTLCVIIFGGWIGCRQCDAFQKP